MHQRTEETYHDFCLLLQSHY